MAHPMRGKCPPNKAKLAKLAKYQDGGRVTVAGYARTKGKPKAYADGGVVDDEIALEGADAMSRPDKAPRGKPKQNITNVIIAMPDTQKPPMVPAAMIPPPPPGAPSAPPAMAPSGPPPGAPPGGILPKMKRGGPVGFKHGGRIPEAKAEQKKFAAKNPLVPVHTAFGSKIPEKAASQIVGAANKKAFALQKSASDKKPFPPQKKAFGGAIAGARPQHGMGLHLNRPQPGIAPGASRMPTVSANPGLGNGTLSGTPGVGGIGAGPAVMMPNPNVPIEPAVMPPGGLGTTPAFPTPPPAVIGGGPAPAPGGPSPNPPRYGRGNHLGGRPPVTAGPAPLPVGVTPPPPPVHSDPIPPPDGGVPTNDLPLVPPVEPAPSALSRREQAVLSQNQQARLADLQNEDGGFAPNVENRIARQMARREARLGERGGFKNGAFKRGGAVKAPKKK